MNNPVAPDSSPGESASKEKKKEVPAKSIELHKPTPRQGSLTAPPPFKMVRPNLVGFIQLTDIVAKQIDLYLSNGKPTPTYKKTIFETVFRNFWLEVDNWAKPYLHGNKSFGLEKILIPQQLAVAIAAFQPAIKEGHPVYFVDPDWLHLELDKVLNKLGYQAIGANIDILFSMAYIRDTLNKKMSCDMFTISLPTSMVSLLISGVLDEGIKPGDEEKSVCMFIEGDKNAECLTRLLRPHSYVTRVYTEGNLYQPVPNVPGDSLIALACNTWRKSNPYSVSAALSRIIRYEKS